MFDYLMPLNRRRRNRHANKLPSLHRDNNAHAWERREREEEEEEEEERGREYGHYYFFNTKTKKYLYAEKTSNEEPTTRRASHASICEKGYKRLRCKWMPGLVCGWAGLGWTG